MALYFLLLDADRLHQEIQPALGACWQRRSFAPALPLVQALLPAAQAFADSHGLGESPLAAVPRGLAFDRQRWRLVASEVLWFAAMEVPEVQTAPEATTWLLAPGSDRNAPRAQQPLIQHAYRGAHDLVFGQAVHAPDRVGVNERDDVARIGEYLAAVDHQRWTVDELAGWDAELTADDLEDELDCAREWFPALRDVYLRAQANGQVVVCEEV